MRLNHRLLLYNRRTQMSFAINILRSNFFKHLVCTATRPTATLFSGYGIFLRLAGPTSFSPSLFSEKRQFLSQTLNTATFSTSPSSSSTPALDTLDGDSYASPYLSVQIRCPKHVADMLSEALLCFGASSVSIDEDDSSEVEDEICVSSIFAACQDVKESISLAVDSIGLKELPSYDVVMHDHTDWIKESRESFDQVEVADGIWIVPEWRKPQDLQATNIILNPGLAFGTGEHPTTKLCLLLLHSVIKGGESFLDYGTGSGILAIAALKFGAAFSAGLDIDPQAIAVARHNAALNSIPPENLFLSIVSRKSSSNFTDEVSHKDMGELHMYNKRILRETEKFDVVVANILLNPLLDLADQIVSFAKPEATVGLSGIISEQSISRRQTPPIFSSMLGSMEVPNIIERYSPFLEGITVSKMDDWACITGSRKKS